MEFCLIFHELALQVAAHFGFSYRQDEEEGARKYLLMSQSTKSKLR
jgi:aminoglycoside 6-adenylyltransferase